MKKQSKNKKNCDIVNKEGTGWFYSDIVKDHFFHPRNLLLKDPKRGEFDAVGVEGSMACGDIMKMWLKIDKKTERIRDVKWRTFGSLIKGERLLMSDYKTEAVENIMPGAKIIDGNGKTNYIEDIIEKKYDGRILDLQLATSNYYKISLTPNHPVPYIARDEVSKPLRKSGERWSEAKDYLIQKSKIRIKPAYELKTGDFLIFQPGNNIKDNKELTNNFCSLLGYYVSDGQIASANRVIFYFNVTEKDYIKKIENIIKKLNIKYRIFKRNTENVICFEAYSKELVYLLSRHGGLPNRKIFSDEVINLSPPKQMLIIDAYIEGGGWSSQQKNNWNEQYFISTSQENLANQLQIMIGRNGIFAPVHRRKSRLFVIKGKKYKNSGEINLIFKKNKQYSWVKYQKKNKCFLLPIRNIISFDYKGYIYDVSLLNKPHVYKVKGISVHNCASAIAATSMYSAMLAEKGGRTIKQALKIKPQDVIKRLGGLPNRKIHCSVLADLAFKKAIENYYGRQKERKNKN